MKQDLSPIDDDQLTVEVKSEIDSLETRLELEVPAWTEAAQFCLPMRAFYGPQDGDQPHHPKPLFNSRGALALQTSSAGFLGYNADPRSAWLKLKLQDELMKESGVADWLETCERLHYAELVRGAFYSALGENAQDLFSTGTAPIYAEEDAKNPGRVIFQARHPRACAISENEHGEIDTMVSTIYLNNRDAFARFGEGLSSTVIDGAKRKPYEKTTLKHLVKPMDERFRNYGAKIHPEMPFLSLWYDPIEGHILDVGAFWEFPGAVGRYSKFSGQTYAWAPGLSAVGDILAATQMSKSRIRLAQLISDPALLIDQGLEGQDDIIPGAHIYRTQAEQSIDAIQVGANYPITLDTEKRQDEIIEQHFNVSVYMMLQQLEGQMTAREVVERTGEKAAVLGYIVGRYQRDILQPLIRRSFNIMLRAGKFPPPPPAVVEAIKTGRGNLSIDFQGFLAQIQKRYYSLNGLNTAMSYAMDIAQLAPLYPKAVRSLDVINFDGLMRRALEDGGIPASTIFEEQEVQGTRQAEAQAQAQAIQAQQQAQAAALTVQNLDKMGKAPMPGSPLERIAEAQK